MADQLHENSPKRGADRTHLSDSACITAHPEANFFKFGVCRQKSSGSLADITGQFVPIFLLA